MEGKIIITDKFINPSDIVSRLDISHDSLVADFGCGTGYFSIPLAKIVEEGKVYSFDVLPQALESVESNAKVEGLSNIVTKRVNLENNRGSGLENGSVDWVIIKDMLFQNKNKEAILSEAKRILKVGGKILVIEWGEKNTTVGPTNEMKISFEELERMTQGQNFKIEKKVDTGDFHYGFVAVKS